jgi:hypothetical protein
MVGRTDVILNFIAVEKSAANLLAARTRGIKVGEWVEEIHEAPFQQKFEQLTQRWKSDDTF